MFRRLNIHDFDCKCGCGENGMQDSFLFKLEDLCEELSFTPKINSGFRCKKHNGEVSTTGDSGPHPTGRAVDISISGGQALNLVNRAVLCGFTGIGLKQHGPHAGRYVHLDDLVATPKGPRPWIWTYA